MSPNYWTCKNVIENIIDKSEQMFYDNITNKRLGVKTKKEKVPCATVLAHLSVVRDFLLKH